MRSSLLVKVPKYVLLHDNSSDFVHNAPSILLKNSQNVSDCFCYSWIMNTAKHYRHYKGNEYEIIGEATHTETEERLIIYKSLHEPYVIWARPYEMFFESVTIDGKEILRFKKIEP